jgi:hypothetical protein
MRSLPILAALLLASCIAPQPRTAVYNPAEYAPYLRAGSGKITGRAFLKTNAGEVKYGAGCAVALHPVTSANREWYEKVIVQGLPLAAGNPHVNDGARHTTADAGGRFIFTGLPAGDYYLTCRIVRHVLGGDEAGDVAYCQVHVPPGGTATAIVTR